MAFSSKGLNKLALKAVIKNWPIKHIIKSINNNTNKTVWNSNCIIPQIYKQAAGTIKIRARKSRTRGWRRAGIGLEAEKCTSRGHRRWKSLFLCQNLFTVKLSHTVLFHCILFRPSFRMWSLIHKLLIGLSLTHYICS